MTRVLCLHGWGAGNYPGCRYYKSGRLLGNLTNNLAMMPHVSYHGNGMVVNVDSDTTCIAGPAMYKLFNVYLCILRHHSIFGKR